MIQKKSMGIIGFGNFTRFMIPYLEPYFDISVYDTKDCSKMAFDLNVKTASLKEVCSLSTLIIAVPIQYLEDSLKNCSSFIQEGTFVIDVSSVKLKTVKLFNQYLHKNVKWVATHPLFGPQSGKNGLTGLSVVICIKQNDQFEGVQKFLKDSLKLNVLLKTPDEHDREMAYVQALSHFVSRALDRMNIPESDQKTYAYQCLLDIRHTLQGDSWDLFFSIQNENPYAVDLRHSFLNELENLNVELDQEK